MKSRKNYRDRISSLPEDIITRIISLLPTSDAVRTSVLAKDWQYRWTSIYNVEIVYPLSSTNMEDFLNIVERVVLHCQNVRSFRLSSVGKHDVTLMKTWMSVIFRRNIERFVVVILKGQDQCIVLPRSLNNCRSLRMLFLYLPCIFRVPVQSFFPNLRKLNLARVHIRNESSVTDTVSFTVPVLESLVLIDCKWVNVKFVEFYAPALIRFKSQRNFDNSDCYIKILGARVEQLDIVYVNVNSLGNYLLTGTTVLSATLECAILAPPVELLGSQVRKLLREFSGLNHLKLLYALEAMSISRGIQIPRYNKLERLEVVDEDVYAEELLEILGAAPFLRFLVLPVPTWGVDFNYGAIKSDCVPSCIVSHLEIVTFEYSDDCIGTSLYSIAKFFLKYGAKLKELCIRIRPDCPVKALITDKLLSFPKASPSLKIGCLDPR